MRDTQERPEAHKDIDEQNTPAEVVELTTSKSRSKKTKMYMVVAAILLLVGGVVGAFVVNEDESSDEPQTQVVRQNTEQENEVSVFKPEYFVLVDSKLHYIDQNKELQDYAQLQENEQAIEILRVKDVTTVRYITRKEKDNGSYVLASYGEITEDGKTELLRFEDEFDRFWSTPLLSPDRRSLVLERSNENGFMKDLVKVNVADGSQEIVFTPTESDPQEGFLSLVGWKDNTSALLQRQTCRQCDGPRLPILNVLNVETSEMSELFDARENEQGLGYGNFYSAANQTKWFVKGGDFGRIWEYNDQYTPDYLFEINTENGDLRRVTERNEATVSLVGFSDDANTVYYAVQEAVPTTSDDPIGFRYYDNEQKIQNPEPEYRKWLTTKLLAINIVDGSEKEISIETRHIREGTYIESMHEDLDGLLILTRNYDSESQVSDYALLHLPLDASEDSQLTTIMEQRIEAGQSFGRALVFKVKE